MVRLVFRPYTQIKRTICTSVSLQTSIRVSPDFILFRHSSPSFGSQQICSYSNLVASNRSVNGASQPLGPTFPPQRYKSAFTFITHQGLYTQILAYMLDSLVRVSRRVNENHFVSISCPNTRSPVYLEPNTSIHFSILDISQSSGTTWLYATQYTSRAPQSKLR